MQYHIEQTKTVLVKRKIVVDLYMMIFVNYFWYCSVTKFVYRYLYRYLEINFLCVFQKYFSSNSQLWWVTFLIFKILQRGTLKDIKLTMRKEISDSMGKVSHVLIFFMYDTHVYHYCINYHIHFNIKNAYWSHVWLWHAWYDTVYYCYELLYIYMTYHDNFYEFIFFIFVICYNMYSRYLSLD